MKNFKLLVFFFSNAAFAFVSALMIHEAGHAVLVQWLLGAPATIRMNPFTGGVTHYVHSASAAGRGIGIAGGGDTGRADGGPVDHNLRLPLAEKRLGHTVPFDRHRLIKHQRDDAGR